ncbi:ATP-grasp domain-containing protein [Streptomyces sclerotialus]|uniref:ATP-grasp domain-containing protein n=1 Tax=Streptomyces sclerotialus TaxID=1957 RepID=UPI0004C55BF0
MSRKNIFVVGLDEGNLAELRAIPDAAEYAFHGLLTPEELQEGEVSVPELLEKAYGILDAFEGSIDAIVTYWDFPASTLVPILGERYGTRHTSLESIVKCEHKYWSRLEQQKVIDEHPRFGQVDLTAERPEPPEGVRFPMWLKPALSYSSELAYGVKDEQEFQEAVEKIRQGISRVGRPFEYILDQLDLPPEMAGVGGQVCLAEEAIAGIQVAVEGYVLDGEVTVYGTLDSVNYPDSSSFLRHQYPSTLPPDVVQRLRTASERVMRQIGMETATFSIEFFYDPHTDQINLLEINPRHSQSHAQIFHYVDGTPNHHIMVALALGKDPRLTQDAGRYEMGAKWYYRWFTDAVVKNVPTPEDIERIEQEIPGVRIEMVPEPGKRLSDSPQQDSYSCELAHIFTGADSVDEMTEKYNRAVAALNHHFEGTPPPEATGR